MMLHGATMNPDPTKVAQNYDSNFQITVTAQNGTNSAVYTVKKAIPAKTEFGMHGFTTKCRTSVLRNSNPWKKCSCETVLEQV